VRPALLDVFADSRGFINQHFKPAQQGMKKRPLAFESLRHETAERLRTHENQRKENRNLQNTNTSHKSFLWMRAALRTSPAAKARKSDKQIGRAMRARR